MRRSDRHRVVLDTVLEPGEALVEAAGAIATRRRRRRPGVPAGGFVLVVTDRRFVAVSASTWRGRPTGEVLASWSFSDGATLAPASLGRARLLLPDRSVVTLAPFGGWSLRRLTGAA